jgi:acyl-CoA thioesterase II
MSEAVDADQPALDELIRLLDLSESEPDVYQGVSPESRLQRVFGGQVAGQALVAAGRTVPRDRPVHSLHSYFIRPGDPNVPIRYEVERVRDGRSFTTRRVLASQHGRTIFVLSASFQLEQPGLEHQPAMPDAPDPETLPTIYERVKDAPELAAIVHRGSQPIDLRYVDDPSWQQRAHGPRNGPHRLWMRANGRLPNDPLLHVCVLTYASDISLLDTVLIRHGLAVGVDPLAMASLDHAMWFHRTFRVDEWILYSMQSPAAVGSRGLATGRFFDRHGRHLVSVVQEGMIRVG